MVKRHRRGAKPGRYGGVFVIRRIFHITFQFIGVLAVGFAIALIAFFWRLSSGPLSIAYFTPYFESALSNEFGKLKIKINDTILTWAGVGRTLEIRLIGAQARNSRTFSFPERRRLVGGPPGAQNFVDNRSQPENNSQSQRPA